MQFPAKVLVLGCGSVSQCTVPLLIEHFELDPSRVTILDMVDNREQVADVLKAGASYVIDEITRDNLSEVLGRHVGAGDVCIDLAWNIDCNEIVGWCRDHGVRYLNTSVELWDPYADAASTDPLQRTLYVRHLRLRRLIESWPDNRGPAAVVEHGANPGLVSHFTKQALVEIAAEVLARGPLEGLGEAIDGANFAEAARLLGVKVIHISERDTQISSVPKEVDEFVNTWSVEGFYEEGIAPAEMGWGTHERRLPPNALQHAGYGPGNQICLAQPACKTWVRSWVPCGEITGMVIRHGEAFTISDHLTVWDDDGVPVYRPTVHYAYCPADVAINSMHELEMRNWQLQERQRILGDEIVSGRDELGVLLMGHPLTAWWTGSLCSIEEARAIIPHQNATTLQVAASILGAFDWMLRSPDAGVRVPDELPWDQVLAVARPYLGTWHSCPVDWNPLRTRNGLFDRYNGRAFELDDPWQYGNFVV